MKCQDILEIIKNMPKYSPLAHPTAAFPGIVQSLMVLNQQTELQVNNVIVILMGTDWSNVVPVEFHSVQDIRPSLITTRAIVGTATSSTKLSKSLCSFNCPNIAIPALSSCGLIKLEFAEPYFSVVPGLVIACS